MTSAYVSLAVGATLGAAFFDLVPEANARLGTGLATPTLVITGFVAFFLLERLLATQGHRVVQRGTSQLRPYATLVLVSDFASALTAVLGAVLALVTHAVSEHMITWLFPIAVGNFLYVAAADLVPELHRSQRGVSLAHAGLMVLGAALVELPDAIGICQ